MENLSDRIRKIKANIERKGEEDLEMRKAFGRALLVVFPGQSAEKFVKNFYIKNKVLFLETESKSFANEIFLKKTGLIEEVNRKKNQVREIRVR